MLSFPQAGLTLALDFANRGEATLALFRRLDEVVRESGGRWYPAKDARMEAADFHRTFPRLAEFRHHLDPGLMSDFWKRMTA
jgi:FAD/FMN-containing dehydrogenase